MTNRWWRRREAERKDDAERVIFEDTVVELVALVADMEEHDEPVRCDAGVQSDPKR